MNQFTWESSTTELLCNPRLPAQELQHIQKGLCKFELKGHFWLSTSGTTDQVKWVALSKEAVLASALAVNSHLGATDRDTWITPLPDFHVGGLGILARSFLSGAKVIDYKSLHSKWDPLAFCECIEASQATLTALVPTQVYDLVVHGICAPKSLRAIIVGGGALQPSLYHRAVALGWKLLPSYGLTECASQVATAELGAKVNEAELPSLKILSHLSVSSNEEGFLCIKGTSLFTGYALITPSGFTFFDPKVNGQFQTEDLGSCQGGYVAVQGRAGSFLKISGESVSIPRLERILEEAKLNLKVAADVALVALPDERLGHAIHLASTVPEEAIASLILHFHEHVLPFERIRKVHVMEFIPRTSLGKLCRAELQKSVEDGIS